MFKVLRDDYVPQGSLSEPQGGTSNAPSTAPHGAQKDNEEEESEE